MFKITDYTIRPPRITISNDVKDVADIVLGISGSEEIASKVLRCIGCMQFGDTIIENPYCIIDCIPDF
mgnify:CR=1 FL=1